MQGRGSDDRARFYDQAKNERRGTNDESDIECAICLDSFAAQTLVTKCGHEFCIEVSHTVVDFCYLLIPPISVP